jgi:hypothetical protein
MKRFWISIRNQFGEALCRQHVEAESLVTACIQALQTCEEERGDKCITHISLWAAEKPLAGSGSAEATSDQGGEGLRLS